MDKALVVLALVVSLNAQVMQQAVVNAAPVVVTPITLESSCSNGNYPVVTLGCSSPLTVTAGDTITCEAMSADSGPENLVFNDPVNGYYDNIRGFVPSGSTSQWAATAAFINSAGGSITPQVSGVAADSNYLGIMCQAWKGARTSFSIDGGAVNLFNSATGPNPTAGTAASPTNANEVINCVLSRANPATTSSGTGFLPSGALTGITAGGFNLTIFNEYQIQTAATATNCPFVSASETYDDAQFSVINASSPPGAKSLTGGYGVPASGQTNGSSASLTVLNSASGYISTLNGFANTSGFSLRTGTAVTFDTSVAPIGSAPVIANGPAHVIGDAGTSIHFPGSNTTTGYQWQPQSLQNLGSGMWYGSFIRVGSGVTDGQGCDTLDIDGAIVEGELTTQMWYSSTNGLYFDFEVNSGDTPTSPAMIPTKKLVPGQDYYIIMHAAGVNEANDDLYILSESTPGTLPWVVQDHFTYPRAGPIQDTTTATAGSGASSITVASATGIVLGQSVWATGIPVATTVTSVSGTTIGISQPTTGSLSSTSIKFTGPTATTTASVTAGSTALTVVSGTGISTGQVVAMAGVPLGTTIASGSGTSWVMSQPANHNESSITASFWPTYGQFGFTFGKFSSCSIAGDEWFSGMIFDPYGLFLPLVASGAIQL